tara:strand:- start:311 stop:496 length:186 start_codon:yes stop_codon:yes gene_type:complete
MKKCPQCGYKPPKKPVGRPQKFTMEEKKEIVEDRKKMSELKTAIKWGCSIGTIQNIVNRNK